MTMKRKWKLAVWKFSSCDGCQLQVLSLGNDLLGLLEHLEIAYFLEASRRVVGQPYDLSLLEGSVTTADEEQRVREVRAASRVLVTIGACATAGGIQALRNYAQLSDYSAAVYPQPEWIDALATSRPASAFVPVDFELHGCPINKEQLLEAIEALLVGRKPQLSQASVCSECKRSANRCVLVEAGTPCLGPVTRAGCGALCPHVQRGCYGCFGPFAGANLVGMRQVAARLGMDDRAWQRWISTFNVGDFRPSDQ
jgi:sulfhydrogenase subunit delta